MTAGAMMAMAAWGFVGPAWTLFLEPLPIGPRLRLVMLVPLVLAIAVVYKTIRTPNVRELPLASVILCLTILLGMFGVGVGLWLFYRVMV